MSQRELLPTATQREARRVVRDLLRKRRGLSLLTAIVLIVAAAVGLLVPPLLGVLVDVVVEQRARSALTTPLVLLAVVALAQAVFSAVGRQLVARLGEAILAELRERVVARAVAIPITRLERAGSGDLLSRVSGDVAIVSQAARLIIPALTQSAIVVSLTLVGMLVLDWRLALAVLLAAPIQLLTLRWYLRTALPIYRRQRIAEGERTQQLVDAIAGAQTARALGIGEQRLEHVRTSSLSAVTLALQGIRLQGNRFFPALNAAELVGLAAVLGTGFLLVRADTITVGVATAGALYFHRAFDPIGTLLMLIDDLQEATTALSRLVGVASIEPPEEPAHPARPHSASLSLTGIGHAYVAGHPVLTDIDLDIGVGERVALIGTTGAGKTTLAKLIAGLERPAAGDLRIGGETIDAIGPAGMRATVALITQDVHVFAGTLADDLRLVAPRAGDAELRAALERVDAGAWVQALPEGLDTLVGESGHRISTTQAQQLALARIMLRDTPIVILDEATAEAGSSGARVLERAADRALEGRTALIVAHRLTQAAAADRVVVLEGGRIVEQGSHDRLRDAGGRYASLWAAWATARTNV